MKIKFDQAGRFGSFVFPVCFELSKTYCYDPDCADHQLIVSFLWWAARWFIWIDRGGRSRGD